MNRKTVGWVELILGILMIVLGIYTLINPVSETIMAIVIAYAIAAIVSGIADFIIYYRLEKRIGFASGMLLASGVLNILVGILLLFNLGAGAWTLTILFPIWFIAHCIARLANAGYIGALGSRFDYWVTVIANVIGIVLGVLLLVNPFASMLSMAYIVAFYLLVVGTSSFIGGIDHLWGRA